MAFSLSKISLLTSIFLLLPGLSFSAYPQTDTENPKKVALVTGASRGIGLSLTKKLLDEGIYVIAVARKVDSLKEMSTQFPSQLQIISADLATKEGQLSVAPAVGKTMIDYLVHNAAVIDPLGKNALLEAAPEEIYSILQVNVVAPIILTNQLAPSLKAGSRILLISSRAGDKMNEGMGLYCISKVALDRYTESLQLDMPKGVLAAAVHPGDVDTDMQGDLRNKDSANFPKTIFFRENASKLTPPDVSATYLKWLLLSTTDKEFTAQKHNIYDRSHQAAWSLGQAPEDPFN